MFYAKQCLMSSSSRETSLLWINMKQNSSEALVLWVQLCMDKDQTERASLSTLLQEPDMAISLSTL